MKFEIQIGPHAEHRITYTRDWMTGRELLLANGHPVVDLSPMSPGTHFSLKLKQRTDFTLPGAPPLLLAFERERPLWFAGFRPHCYRLIVNGQVVLEKRGY